VTSAFKTDRCTTVVRPSYARCAKYARKVAIVDLDVHHGNGTEDIVRQARARDVVGSREELVDACETTRAARCLRIARSAAPTRVVNFGCVPMRTRAPGAPAWRHGFSQSSSGASCDLKTPCGSCGLTLTSNTPCDPRALRVVSRASFAKEFHAPRVCGSGCGAGRWGRARSALPSEDAVVFS
jgi:hypothetical protein